MLNQIVIVGRLVKDPISKELEDGRKVSNITLAVQRNFKNPDGAYDTDFIDCTLWRGIAENTVEYCGKGSVIGVKGRLVTSLYTNEEGATRKNVEVVAEKVSFIGSSRKDEEAYY